MPLTLLAAVFLVGCAARSGKSLGSPPVAVPEGYLPGADGTRIFYRVVGTGPESIVALHGGPGGDLTDIAPNLSPLAANRRVIYYDQRGGGRSELPSDTALLDVRYFVEDLEAVRRFFGLERMNVLAHSFGSIIVAKYAETYPDRLAKLILNKPVALKLADAVAVAQSTYTQASTGAADRMRKLVAALQAGTAPDAVAACREYFQLNADEAAARGELSAWRNTPCEAPAEAVKYSFQYTSVLTVQSVGKWDASKWIARTSAPVLVVSGDRDPSVVPHMNAWAAAVSNGRTLIVPNTFPGSAPADRPEIFYPAVDAFMRGEWPQGAVAPPH